MMGSGDLAPAPSWSPSSPSRTPRATSPGRLACSSGDSLVLFSEPRALSLQVQCQNRRLGMQRAGRGVKPGGSSHCSLIRKTWLILEARVLSFDA